jgi:hypothetical protein
MPPAGFAMRKIVLFLHIVVSVVGFVITGSGSTVTALVAVAGEEGPVSSTVKE